MKKIIIANLLILLGIASQAQEVHFGLKGGLNIANIKGDHTNGDSRTLYHAGAMAEVKLSELFSLQPEVIYSVQGSEGGVSLDYGPNPHDNILSAKITQETKYLNVPIMGKYYVLDALSLELGPQIGFLLNAEQTMTLKSELGHSTNTRKAKEEYNTFDFGVNFGAGYTFNDKIYLNARYNLGLTNVYDSDYIEGENSVFQCSLGYFF